MPHLMLATIAIPRNIMAFLHDHGALALFLLVFLQDVGVPTGVPGTVLVLFGGYLVYSGVVGLHQAALAVAAGAFLGASGMFMLARVGGRPLVLRLGRFVGLTDKGLNRAAVALERWGPPLLLITRIAPGTRVYMTIFAGISGWTYKRFALWTAIFVLVWAYGFVYLGSVIGQNLDVIAGFIQQYSILLLVIIVALVGIFYGLRGLITHPRTRDLPLARWLATRLPFLLPKAEEPNASPSLAHTPSPKRPSPGAKTPRK